MAHDPRLRRSRCVSASKFDPAHIPSITLILLMVCAFVPIGDRLPILTPSPRLHHIDLIGDFGLSPGS